MMSILALPLTFLIAPSLGIESDTANSTIPEIPRDEACIDSLDIAIFNSPRRPHKRAPMRVLVGIEKPGLEAAKIALVPPEGPAFYIETTPSGGPPWGLRASLDKPAPGKWRAAVIDRGAVVACQEIEVGNGPSGPGSLEVGADPFWESRIRWERDVENLYSLWIEHLFDAPLEDDVSWNPLALVLKDPARNLLYDHLGLNEDKDGFRARPDCADFPYTLRAYFAWKMGLPMAMRNCRRGNAERAPTCGTDLVTNELPTDESNRVAAFKSFLRKLSGTVHSSSLRGAPNDPKSDFYPVRLDRHGLRPGTIYADPYGHTMMALRWYPQTPERAGVLMAVDAQPDGTVGRRVFWKGAFMFPKDDDVAGAGWKRFRPVRKRGSQLVELDNAEISESPDYGDYSVEQWAHGQDGFYEAMDALISPAPMSPEMALSGLLDALHQQALRRVESIEAVRPYFEKNPDRTIPMPEGSGIFLTAGPWEDFSTPARDMRMLIAIDTVQDFAARVARRPDRFILDPTETAETRAKRLADLTEVEAKRRTLTYMRSDGSARTLTLADLMARELQIELAWNPNDCPEFRWGAPEGSEEASTCKRRATASQQGKMAEMRAWFSARQRPLQH